MLCSSAVESMACGSNNEREVKPEDGGELEFDGGRSMRKGNGCEVQFLKMVNVVEPSWWVVTLQC